MFNIKFDSVEQINVVLMSLAKQPYEVSAPLIALVRNQAQEQAQKAAAEAQESAGRTE